MATAEHITFSSASVQSPCVIIPLAAAASQQVVADLPETQSGTRPSRKGLLTTQAPTLTPANQPSEDYQQKIAQYMMEILFAMIALAGDNQKVAVLQSNVGNNLVSLTTAQAAQAKKSMAEYEKKVEEEAHESKLHKIFSCLASGLMMVVGAITFDPVMFAMGATMLAMNLSNNGSLINNELNKLPLGARLGIEVAVIAIMAACGGYSGAEEAAESTTTEETATATASGASDSTDAASEDTTEENKSNFSTRRALGVAGLSTSIVNPFTDLYLGFSELIHKKSKSSAEMFGMVASAVAALAGGYAMATSSAAGEASEASSADGISAEKATAIKKGLLLSISGMNIGAAVFSILAGKTMMGEASVMDDMGVTQGQQTITTNTLSMNSSQVSQNQIAQGQVNDTYQQINSRWDAYVNQYAMAARVIGQA